MLQQGSRLKADYEVTWDKDGAFRNGRSQTEESRRWMPKETADGYRNEVPRHSSASHFSANNVRSKRFKVGN